MFGEPQPKTYKLDFPVDIRAKKSCVYTIINQGLFQCKRISIEAVDRTELENVVITPHIASATKGARDKMSEMAATNIIAVLDGQTPPNLVKECQ